MDQVDPVSCAIMRIRAFSVKSETLSKQEVLDELDGIATDVDALGESEQAQQLRKMVDSMRKRYRMDLCQN